MAFLLVVSLVTATWAAPSKMKMTTAEGYENNWLETIPDKGWFTILRIYGPLKPRIDKTWMPGDFEPVK